MTFNQWLKQQIERDDPIGDVARDVSRDDRCKPQNTLVSWRNFLSAAGACQGAHDALDEAWDEYLEEAWNEYKCSSATN